MKFNSKYKIQIILMVFSFCTAVYSLYLTMHLSQIGFNGEKIGLIYGGISITGMLSQPIYLLINKKCKNNRLTLFISLFFASFAIISLVFIKSFTTILIVTSIICFFTVSLVSILDGMAVTYCLDNKIKYSSMKLWSSVGYALGSILLGGIYVKFGFSINLLVCGAGYMAIIIIIKSTPKDIWLSENDLGINKEKVISKSFLSYLPFIVLVYGMNVVGCNNYGLLFPYLDFPDEIIGFSSFVSLLGEILTIIIIGKYVSKRNHTKLMILGTSL